MGTTQNILTFKAKVSNDRNNNELYIGTQEVNNSALIDCINQLNLLRNNEDDTVKTITYKQKTEGEVLEEIDHISAQMKWFSQWSTVKSQSVA